MRRERGKLGEPGSPKVNGKQRIKSRKLAEHDPFVGSPYGGSETSRGVPARARRKGKDRIWYGNNTSEIGSVTGAIRSTSSVGAFTV